MPTSLDITPNNSRTGNSMTLAAATLPLAGLEALDTPLSTSPLSMLQVIAAQVMLTLEESRLTDFEALA